jgi:hypothetical protein
MNKKTLLSILNVIVLCVVVFAVSAFFVYNKKLIGFVLIGLGLLSLLSLIPFGIKVKSLKPDILFGLIDNGVLAIMAVFGGYLAGVAGAIIGGVVGNAITDALAGIFEGYSAEKMKEKNGEGERTILGSAVGKMAGCLFGAGIVLVVTMLLGF